MLETTAGESPPKGKGRKTLCVRDPIISASLAAYAFDDYDVEETRRFGNALLASRNAWADRHRNGRRYSDKATARLRNSLAERGKGRGL